MTDNQNYITVTHVLEIEELNLLVETAEWRVSPGDNKDLGRTVRHSLSLLWNVEWFDHRPHTIMGTTNEVGGRFRGEKTLSWMIKNLVFSPVSNNVSSSSEYH